MKKLILAASALLALCAIPAQATTTFDTSLNSWASGGPAGDGSVHGSGQVNGGFVRNVSDPGDPFTYELGIRAQQRGVGPLPSASIIGSTYHVPVGPDPSAATRAWWNFDFSVNLLNDPTLNIGLVNPILQVDIDPSTGITYVPYSLALFSNYNPANKLDQDSSNIAFLPGMDFNINATYNFLLTITAPDGDHSVGMTVVVGDGGADPVVPEPATLTLIGLGTSGLAMLRRRRASK